MSKRDESIEAIVQELDEFECPCCAYKCFDWAGYRRAAEAGRELGRTENTHVSTAR